ncbi:hypothetical protein H0I23_05200 [Cellulophaga sp. HaHaR_3_176]|uniref:hypothetical protein n=1 Tax=Cellulophaga sp. HaHaR_3_176 TaxID=1942464 RepID=UPI001C1F769D|nr:hypothetical protein [Cellulophaga sp. HaHaR_3_176]QWX85034.1 hypothetical protein H0I23_05200 [Cellulophaga sp. HaHaR_3_176]
MNYKSEPFPSDIKAMLHNTYGIASIILDRLNESNCPELGALYMELHKTCGAKPEYSVIRDKKVFDDLGYLPNILSGKSRSLNEFKGLYVFGREENGKVIPVYVGISRTVYRRLRQHGFGKLHNQCSLAYLMSKHENDKIDRSNIHKNFNEILICKKENVKSFKVALYAIEKDYELYFTEVALAGILKTKWNSFRTH